MNLDPRPHALDLRP